MSSSLKLNELVGFEWDKHNIEHIKKHSVNYIECEDVFFNKPLRINEDESHSKIEDRWEALGKTSNNRLLFISFTIRNNRIRVISARNQNRKERKIYVTGGEKDE